MRLKNKQKNIVNKPLVKGGSRTLSLAFVFVFLVIVIVGMSSYLAAEATGSNCQSNVQGYVVAKNVGTNVATGSYSFTFSIYTVASGGSAVWTETKSITVTDGIFQTNLGDTTSLPGSVDFNTDNIYLGINFNSDGEMSPRVRFTATPYAMNAEKVGGLTVTNTTGTLTVPAGKTISFGGAFSTSGTNDVAFTTAAATALTLPTTGTLATLAGTEILTNKTIGSTGVTFSGATTDITTASGESLDVVAAGAGIINLNDAVTITGTTTLSTLTSAAAVAIGINSGTTGAINIGDDGSAETISIGTGAAAKTVVFGSTNTTSTSTFQSGTGGITLAVAGTATTGTVQVGAGGVGSTTPDLLGLDVKSDAGDPAGTEGKMYYNNSTNKFRCFEDTAWTDCRGSGAPGGSTTQIQFNDAGSFGGDADFVWDKTTNDLTLPGTDTGITMNAITNEPSAPSGSNLHIYSKNIAGRVVPKWIGPAGVDTPFQAALWGNNTVMWTPTTATAGVWQGTAGAGAGTYTTALPTATNFYTAMKRGQWATVVTTTNQQVGQRSTENMFFRGSVAGQGGFFFFCRFGTTAWTAGDRLFVGLIPNSTAVVTANPSLDANSVGFGIDAGDTAITFMHNDAAGSATKDVIAGQPALAANQGYDAYIYAKPNDTTVYYRLVNLNTGAEIINSSTATDLPVNTTMMSAHAVISNGANTPVTSAQIGVNRMYVESDR